MSHSIIDKVTNVKQAIKSRFNQLLQRMQALKNSFVDWLQSSSAKRSRRSLDQQTEEALWNQFLVSYNSTDPVLVEHLYESLTYFQFQQAIASINQTLTTEDFGPSNSNTNSELSALLMTIALLCMLCTFR